MFTLDYANGHFSRPTNLSSFLRNNIGGWPQIKIYCITPYEGTDKDMANTVCQYLSNIDPEIEVTPNIFNDKKSSQIGESYVLQHLVLQIRITQRT